MVFELPPYVIQDGCLHNMILNSHDFSQSHRSRWINATQSMVGLVVFTWMFTWQIRLEKGLHVYYKCSHGHFFSFLKGLQVQIKDILVTELKVFAWTFFFIPEGSSSSSQRCTCYWTLNMFSVFKLLFYFQLIVLFLFFHSTFCFTSTMSSPLPLDKVVFATVSFHVLLSF